MKLVLALIAALAFPTTSALAQHLEIGPGGVHIDPDHHHDSDHEHHWGDEHEHHWGGDCRHLRWRCEHKEELGEVGHGNCERYRRECGGD